MLLLNKMTKSNCDGCWVILVIVLIVIFAIGGYLLWAHYQKKPKGFTSLPSITSPQGLKVNQLKNTTISPFQLQEGIQLQYKATWSPPKDSTGSFYKGLKYSWEVTKQGSTTVINSGTTTDTSQEFSLPYSPPQTYTFSLKTVTDYGTSAPVTVNIKVTDINIVSWKATLDRSKTPPLFTVTIVTSSPLPGGGEKIEGTVSCIKPAKPNSCSSIMAESSSSKKVSGTTQPTYQILFSNYDKEQDFTYPGNTVNVVINPPGAGQYSHNFVMPSITINPPTNLSAKLVLIP